MSMPCYKKGFSLAYKDCLKLITFKTETIHEKPSFHAVFRFSLYFIKCFIAFHWLWIEFVLSILGSAPDILKIFSNISNIAVRSFHFSTSAYLFRFFHHFILITWLIIFEYHYRLNIALSVSQKKCPDGKA